MFYCSELGLGLYTPIAKLLVIVTLRGTFSYSVPVKRTFQYTKSEDCREVLQTLKPKKKLVRNQLKILKPAAVKRIYSLKYEILNSGGICNGKFFVRNFFLTFNKLLGEVKSDQLSCHLEKLGGKY